MNKIIVGMGEALWDCLPRRKEDRRCSGKLCLPCIAVWFRQPCGQCRRCRCGWGRDSGCVRPEGLRTQIERVPYPTGTVQVTLDAVGVPCYEIKEGVAWDNIPFTDELEASGTEHACRMFRLFGATQ